MSKKAENAFYITTTLPYVNADPHIGFAMELVRADVVARYKQMTGYDVFFNTGTDEHGAKIHEKALETGVDPQAYVDEAAQKFKGLVELLGISPEVHFIRTTDEHHEAAAQAFWRRCNEKGDIYKGVYEIKYCVGCELEKTESDLNEEGRCPIHPTRELEIREEENYFFRFSKYADALLKLYDSTPDFVIPDFRQGEIRAFVERGLEDFSVSRLKEKMPWGIEVPDDPEHVMYVWFDALVNYVSTLGWPEDEEMFEKYWVNGTPTQYAGKDNLRQQSAMWQAMLMSAGLPNSRQIIINGFITSGGQKMSKSLGNVISPHEIVEKYGTDALRYYLVRELQPFEDSDFTQERFAEAYNANLANGLGNLVSRIMKMAETHLTEAPDVSKRESTIPQDFKDAFERFDLQAASDSVWEHIQAIDGKIQETEPFKLIKTDSERAKEIIAELVLDLYGVADMLSPLMPATSTAIKEAVKTNTKPETLFPRIDVN
ncbi:MAG: methionine--tRNA ligase [Candidatus Paceibacterota bacterium]